MRVNLFFIKYISVILIDYLKKYVINIDIFSIIIVKLYYQQKFDLVILFKVNKYLKIDFYFSISLFGLTIHLKIKYSKYFEFNIREKAK